MATERPADDRIIDERETSRLCGNASRTSMWRWTRTEGFPRPVPIGPRRKGRWKSEVLRWLDRRAEGGAS